MPEEPTEQWVVIWETGDEIVGFGPFESSDNALLWDSVHNHTDKRKSFLLPVYHPKTVNASITARLN